MHEENKRPQNPRLRTVVIAAAVAIPTLVYVWALLFDPGRDLVLWDRNPALTAAQVAPIVIGLILYGAIAITLFATLNEQPSRKKTALVLLFVFLSGMALQTAATRVLEEYPLRAVFLRQYSEFSGGYFTIGVRAGDLREFLSRFAAEMASYPVHPQRHPPGLPLIFWGAAKVMEAAPGLSAAIANAARPLACFDARAAQLTDPQIAGGALGAVMESVLAWLTPIALYFLVRRIASQRAALLAALLYPLMPGALMWVSQWDRAFGLFAVLGLWMCESLAQARTARAGLAFALGLLLAIAALMSFGNTPIMMMCAVYALARVSPLQPGGAGGGFNLRLRLTQAAFVLLGFVLLWMALAALFGFDVPGAYRTSMSIHLSLDRPFWPFVLWHAWDIFTFIGLPLVALALFASWQKAPALAAAFALTIFVLCVAHVARGETGRVWMFFAPVVAALAAINIIKDDWDPPITSSLHHPVIPVTLVILFMIGQSAAHISLLNVISYGRDPITVPDAQLPVNLTPTQIRFERGGEIQLLGYTAPAQLSPGQSSSLTLYWKLNSSQSLPASYKIFVHIAENAKDEGRIVNQDSMPMNWASATTCWRPGQIVEDRHDFNVDASAKPGQYVILVGLYDPYTNQRAFVNMAQIAVANAVQLPNQILVK